MPEPITVMGFGGGVLGLAAHLARRNFELAKEVMDILAGAMFLILAAPVIVVCVALIKLTSKGPAFYTQMRVGKNGKLFRIYKLRTMYCGAEGGGGAMWARRGDNRVIPVCRWMRRSHVDELPQLVNVIKGEMSLVGPRPERPEIMAQLKQHYPEVEKRLTVRPGITGLAQVRCGYDTDIDKFRNKLMADLEYIDNRRWSMELSILVRTFPKFNDKTAH